MTGDSTSKEDKQVHPFSGLLTSLIGLVANLSHDKDQDLEDYLLSESGWRLVGLVLCHTKLDLDNPCLREWAIVFVRNVTNWSEPIKAKLAQLTLVDGADYDPESKAVFDALGDPLKQMYKKEMDKYKRDD